ncbi:MAG: DUF1232 domain-containing protein [Tissierellales bacterium]|nr:DUF1232 domain-containing protein [Tissierellales bacterium]
MDKEKIEKAFEENIKKIKQEDILKVLTNSDNIFEKLKDGPLKEFTSHLNTLLAMLKDYKSGDYKEIPWSSITIITATLLYIISPLDAIPDFLPAIGLADDAFVVTICLKMITKDIENYKKFKEQQQNFIKQAENYGK